MFVSKKLKRGLIVLIALLIVPTVFSQTFDAIPNLTAEVGDDVWTVREVKLQWTAPGLSGVGTAASYIIRYGLSSTWDEMTTVTNPPTPQTAGVSESFYIDNLSVGNVYYFAVKSINGEGTESDISNIAIATPIPDGNYTSSISYADEAWVSINHLAYGDTLFIQIVNGDNAGLNELEVVLSSDSEDSQEYATLFETNINSGVYRGFVAIDPDNSVNNDGILIALSGDFIATQYSDPTNEWGAVENVTREIPYGGTPIAGEISGTWTFEESPYFIFGHINTNGQSLTLEEGTTVVFLGEYSATIGGAFTVNGTVDNPVNISAHEIQFQAFDLHSQSSVSYCQIENGSGGLNAYNEITILNSHFSNCGYALQLRGALATVDYCEFTNNAQAGIIVNNLSSTYTINNSVFRDNQNGLTGDNTSHVAVSNCIFVNNASSGLTLDDVDITISNSLIAYNGNYGINIGFPDFPAFAFSISHSALYENQSYEIRHSSSNNISAQSNWWGYATTHDMYSGANPQNLLKIYDYYDDSNLGLVNYSNWLPAPSVNTVGVTESITSLEFYIDSTYTTLAPGWISSGETVYIQAVGEDVYPYLSSVTSLLATTSATTPGGQQVALIESEASSGIWRGRLQVGDVSSYSGGTLGGMPGETLTIAWIGDSEINSSLLIEEPTPPPTGLTVSTGLSDYIQLAWVAPSSTQLRRSSSSTQLTSDGAFRVELSDNSLREVIGYNVYRALSSNGPFSLIEENTPLLTYSDLAVQSGNSYHYYITALYLNPETESEPSNISSGMRGNIPAVTELQYDDGGAESAYSWNSISGNGVRFTTGETFSQITSVSVFIAWPEDPTIPFEIRVYDAAQNTIRAGIIGQATGPNQWVTIDLSQQNIVSGGTEFYVALYYPNAGGPWIGSDQTSASNRSYSVWWGWDFRDAPGENYMIRAAYTPIAAPHSLYAQSDRDNEVYLTWLSPQLPQIPGVDMQNNLQVDSEIAESPVSLRTDFQFYNIYRSPTASGPYTNIAQNVTGNHYLDANIQNGHDYFYVVTASYTDPNLESAYSNEASATPTGLLSPVLFVDDDDWWGWIGGWGLHQPFENALINAQIPCKSSK